MLKLILSTTAFFLALSITANLFAQRSKPSGAVLVKKLKDYSSPCRTPCIKDTIKVNLLLDLAVKYLLTNPEAVTALCNQAIQLSQKINYPPGIAQSYHLLGKSKKEQENYEMALTAFSNELQVLNGLNEKSEKITLKQAACYNSLANTYLLLGKYDKAFQNAQTALKLNTDYRNEAGIAASYKNMGDIYLEGGEFSKALEHLLKGIKIAEKLEDGNLLATIKTSIGSVYYKQNNFVKAVLYYYDAALLNKKSGDYRSLGFNFIQVGLMCAKLPTYPIAIQYFDSAQIIFESINLKTGVALANNSIGGYYYNKAEFFKRKPQPDSVNSYSRLALIYFWKAYNIQQQVSRNNQTVRYLLDVGKTYLSLKQYDDARNYLHKSLALSDSLKDSEGISISRYQLAKFFAASGKYDSSLYHYERSVTAKEDFARKSKTDEITRLQMSYEYDKEQALTKAEYEKQKQIAQAEKLRAIAEADKKTLLAETDKKLQVAAATQSRLVAENEKQSTQQELKQQQINAQFERKESQQQIKLATTEAQLQKQKTFRYAVAGGAGLLIIAVIFGFLLYKRNAEQKQKETSLSLQVSETEMKALRSQMNPHFVFNALQSIQTFLLSHKADEANAYLLKFAKLMRLVLENSQHSEVLLKDDMQALELYMQLESIRLRHPFTYKFHVDQSVNIEDDTIPPLILQPFVENAIWHGLQYKPEPGHIDIYISKKNHGLYATVEDNGVGRDMSKQVAQPMLLKKESLGMKLTEERLKLLSETKNVKAQFHITDLFSNDNMPAGTKVELSLALA